MAYPGAKPTAVVVSSYSGTFLGTPGVVTLYVAVNSDTVCVPLT